MLATLRRIVCPCVMPTMPNEMRSGCDGATSWACTRRVSRKMPRDINAASATSPMIVTSVRFVFIFLLLGFGRRRPVKS